MDQRGTVIDLNTGLRPGPLFYRAPPPHACFSGSPEYGIWLSSRRAKKSYK
jgi:hypothetical protein